MTLADELELYGATVTPVDFNDIIQELLAVMYPQWNSEQLLYEPQHCREFCGAVRARCGGGLPDRVILRRLTNLRKRSRDDQADTGAA